MQTGMRVHAHWAAERKGFITDIAYFSTEEAVASEAGEAEDVAMMESPIYLNYHFTAGEATARFLAELKEGRIVGQKCPISGDVYIPPRGSSPKYGVPTTEEVVLGDKATVQSFTIVYIPIPGNPIKPPYIIANLVPDGANISLIHLISDCNNEDIHIGKRVQAVWKPEEEWDYGMENIKYFKPIDEPDVPVDQIGKTQGEG